MPIRFALALVVLVTQSFRLNGDGTVTDTAAGLMWQQTDSGRDDTRAWIIDFRLGIGTYTLKTALRRVRCVRGGL